MRRRHLLDRRTLAAVMLMLACAATIYAEEPIEPGERAEPIEPDEPVTQPSTEFLEFLGQVGEFQALGVNVNALIEEVAEGHTHTPPTTEPENGWQLR